MARAPIDGPMLDQIGGITLAALEPAKIRHLQRADLYAHALMSAWGGPGFYVPMHLEKSDTPDDPTVPVHVPPGMEHFAVQAIVSYGSAKGAEAVVTLTSAATADTCTLRWQDTAISDSLEGAVVITADEPLQVRSGINWEPSVDTITVEFDAGSGVVWGLLFVPIYSVQ